MVKDLRTMNTSCWEEAGVQSCYLPHVTTLTGMGYRRGLIAPSPKAGALGSRAHPPEKTTLTWFSREASTVCPGVKRGKETIGYRKQKWPRWATSAGGRGKVKPGSDTLSTWDVRVLQGVLVRTGHTMERGVYSFPVTHLLLLIWPLILSTDKFLGTEVFHYPWLESTVNNSTLVFVTHLTKEGRSHFKSH